jgi:hypothetical protein
VPDDFTGLPAQPQTLDEIEARSLALHDLPLHARVESLEHDRKSMIRVLEEMSLRLDVLEARIDALVAS